MNTDLEIVQGFADAGFKLIRLRKRSKLPAEDDWADHTYSPKEIVRWLSMGGNWGAIIPPCFLICDADARSGGREGLSQFKQDSDLDIDWSRVPLIRTGGYDSQRQKCGMHAIFRKPSSVTVIARDKATNLEWRSSRVGTSGKYIVGPLSQHPSGRHYALVKGVLPADAPLLPRYWLEQITKKPKAVADAPEAGQVTPERLAELLAFLDPCDFDHNDSWLALLMACVAATNCEGCDAFTDWSIQDVRFSDQSETIRARWDSCDANEPNGITARTLYRAVIDAGCPLNLLPGYVAPEDDFTEVEVIGDDEYEREVL